MKKTITLFFAVLFTTLSYAQKNYEDVVYLKNGSIIRGVITEQIPNESLKIETTGNSLFVYKMSEVQKIAKEVNQKKNSSSNKTDYWSLSLGLSLPSGDFADEDEAGAAVGFNLGVKYLYPLNEKGLGLYVGADFNYNGLQDDVKDDLEDYYEQQYSNNDIDFSEFINIPITTGLNYTYNTNNNLSLFGSFGVGLDFLQITDSEIEYDDDYYEKASYDLSTQFAYKIGGGIILEDKYIIGLHYNGLGEHRIKGEYEYESVNNEGSGDIDTQKLDLSSFTLTIGMKL